MNSVSLSGSISSMASSSSRLLSPSETAVTSRSGASFSISVLSSQSLFAFKGASNSENDFYIFFSRLRFFLLQLIVLLIFFRRTIFDVVLSEWGLEIFLVGKNDRETP